MFSACVVCNVLLIAGQQPQIARRRADQQANAVSAERGSITGDGQADASEILTMSGVAVILAEFVDLPSPSTGKPK